MKIQSLSILVPAPCTNQCPFRVSRMNTDKQENYLHESHIEKFLESNNTIHELSFIKAWKERLEYVSNLDVHSLMLTSTGEAMLNLNFIRFFGVVNNHLEKPFRFIELQTSGMNMTTKNIEKLMLAGVKTISLSLSSLDTEENYVCNNPTNIKHKVDIDEVCKLIKAHHINLRLSLNLTKHFENKSLSDTFNRLTQLGANQVIFRKLYTSDNENLPQNKWIKSNSVDDTYLDKLNMYIHKHGKIIDKNFLGVPRYDIHGVSTVLDEDCMSQQVADNYRYLILKPDCHLYTKWQEPASLLF